MPHTFNTEDMHSQGAHDALNCPSTAPCDSISLSNDFSPTFVNPRLHSCLQYGKSDAVSLKFAGKPESLSRVNAEWACCHALSFKTF